MICKFCNEEIEDRFAFCPMCGKPLGEDTAENVQEADAAPACECVETPAAVYEAPVPQQPKKSGNIWVTVLAITGAVVLLVGLGLLLLTAFGVKMPWSSSEKTAATEAATEATTEPTAIVETDNSAVLVKDTYAVEDALAIEQADTVVATMGDAVLTNAQLQVYYRMQVLDFVNYYGSYLSAVGLDTTQPLSAQPCAMEEGKSWEQYFLEAAVSTWSSYQSMALEGKSVGFEMSQEMVAELEKIPEEMEKQAQEGGYDSVDAMVKELLGAACDLDDYLAYVELTAYGNEYYSSVYDTMIPTDEDVENYFVEYESMLLESGITKDMGLVSSVRHILVCPKADETSQDATDATAATQSGYTDEQWQACTAEAERILQEWKDGDATEESFAELVAIYTEDGGSAQTGGLYEGINPNSSYVENFLKWSVDMNRMPGDTDIVQTEYGYHIMYFVSGEPYWREVVYSEILNERTKEFLESVETSYIADVKYEDIALAELLLG